MELQTSTDYRVVSDLMDAAIDAQNAVDDAYRKWQDAKRERAAVVAELRKQGLGSYRIARAIGVSATAVQDWTKGQNNG